MGTPTDCVVMRTSKQNVRVFSLWDLLVVTRGGWGTCAGPHKGDKCSEVKESSSKESEEKC